MWSATVGATPVKRWTCAASATFSYGSRGTPALGEHLEPRPGVPEGPRGQLDPLLSQDRRRVGRHRNCRRQWSPPGRSRVRRVALSGSVRPDWRRTSGRTLRPVQRTLSKTMVVRADTECGDQHDQACHGFRYDFNWVVDTFVSVRLACVLTTLRDPNERCRARGRNRRLRPRAPPPDRPIRRGARPCPGRRPGHDVRRLDGHDSEGPVVARGRGTAGPSPWRGDHARAEPS